MTVTFNQLVDEVLINLAGYTLQQDRSTYLSSAVTGTTSSSTSPTILQLGGTENLGKGMVEIDEELMWIDSYDRIANTATVAPYGRGYLNTTAATHAVDSRVVISPTFPRSAIKRAINDTIRGVGNNLLAVKQTTFTYNPVVTTYAFANMNIRNILNISWQTIGPSKEWKAIRHWSWDAQSNPSGFGYTSTDSVQTVTVGDYITPGRTVQVNYTTTPTVLSSNSDNFATVTGLPESAKDVIVLGAAWRLLTFLDPARAAMISPQADETDSKRPYGSSQTASKQLYALYTQRLNEEVMAQQKQFPIRVHYSR